MGRLGSLFNFFGPCPQLLGLNDQQIAAGIDADIIKLGCLLAQLLDGFHVLFELAGVSRINLIKRNARLTIGQSKN